MKNLGFPILQDIEISCTPFLGQFSFENALCHSAPLLRRCRFRDIPSLPPLPSNLVILDCVLSGLGVFEFDLDPLLEFLPHVVHSLEHLRFGPPSASKIRLTPRKSRIPLENLKSLLLTNSHVIMDHILAPNLTHFAVSHPPEVDARETAGMFDGFSAPKLQSIQFQGTPLLPFLATHNLPSMFPRLESVSLSDCTDESAFVSLLEPTKPSPSKKPSKQAPEYRKAENPFPHLKQLTISDVAIWTSLQGAIEKRLKNGGESLRKIQLPEGVATGTILPHLRRWLPPLGIELILYERGELPMSTPEFQDEFCEEEELLFSETSMVADNLYLGEGDYDWYDDREEYYEEEEDDDFYVRRFW